MAGAPIQAHRRLLIAYHKTRGKAALFCKFAPRPGGEMMGNEGRSRSSNAMLAKYTKYAAIVFFVLAILVGVISIYLK